MLLIQISNSTINKYIFKDTFKNNVLSIKDNKIILNNYYFDNGLDNIIFKPTKYIIHNKSLDLLELYFYEDETGINDYKIYEYHNFLLSHDNDSNIKSSDHYFKNYYLAFNNKSVVSNYPHIYINGNKYNNEILRNGDYIECLSFSFYYFDNYLYINNYLTINNLNIKTLDYKLVRFEKQKIKLNNYYEESYQNIEVDELKSFNAPSKSNNRNLIFQMGPSLTMSLAMLLVASFNIYNSYLNDVSYYSLLAMAIMPITMLISGISWPIITSLYEKKSFSKEYQEVKKDYLNYLYYYEDNLKKKINYFLKSIRKYNFETCNINNHLFYISNTNKEFLNISLGEHNIELDLKHNLTKDNQINEVINRIIYRLKHIEAVPLYLDIKSNNKITIISDDPKYHLYKTLLELSYKYHFDDVLIVVYSKEISIFNNLIDIPHLFNEGIRYTLNNERQLIDINNLKLNKPIVILMYDYSSISFNRDNIYSLYFSNDSNNILKQSDSIVEYKDDSGLLNNKISFNYVKEDIDFNYYFSIIGSFNNTYRENRINCFSDIYCNLDILKYYQSKQVGLIGEFASINDEVLSFDMHESKDGPHGLIGGTTGSGKSELVISLLLSLIIRYRPDYLNIIIIDYKGGGLKESLSYDNKTVAHVLAEVNNLDEDSFERLIVTIKRELKNRQLLFKELSKVSNISIMNIDEYLELNKQYNFVDIAHLLIVVDEFAELKKEQPSVIKELISFARIGRSLGLHLLLATQKPSGIIDEEIFANTHYKIALKLHSEKDSYDLIKSSAAAYLKNPGEFYLRVDDSLIKAKAIYSKQDISNNGDCAVELLNNKLEVIKRKIIKNSNKVIEANIITSKVIEATNLLNIKTTKYNFLKEEEKTIDYLINKYNFNNELIIGEKDDYLNAYKDLLSININDNLFIYSTRLNEINNLINNLNRLHRQTIIIGKQIYKGEYISDSLEYKDEDNINYLLNKLLNENDSYLTLIIEDILTLLSYNETYQELLIKLCSRSLISNISIIILSNSSAVNFKLLNSFKRKLAIEIFDKQDLINIFSFKSEYKGKSYFYDERLITFVACKIENIIAKESIINKYIETIPLVINYESEKDKILLGYLYKERIKQYISRKDKLLITSFDRDLLNNYQKIFNNDTNIIIKEYNSLLKIDDYNGILWLGEGLFIQRLFYVTLNTDILINQAYYYKNNKGKILIPINYE